MRRDMEFIRKIILNAESGEPDSAVTGFSDDAMSAERSTEELLLALDERTRAANELGSAIWPEVTPNREPLC